MDVHPLGGDGADPFAELDQLVAADEALDATLRRVVELTKQTLPGIADVSVTLIEDDGQPRTVVSTGPLALTLDDVQYRQGFGPCMDASIAGQTLTVDHDDASSPYRAFAQVALRSGIRHIVSVGLPAAQRTVGGLNIYRSAEPAFDTATIEQAERLAGYAAAALSNAARYASTVALSTRLRKTLDSRAVIEQAKGVIMVRDHCSAEEAFVTLKQVSQTENRKIRALALSIVQSLGG